jgi:hypothetical protein
VNALGQLVVQGLFGHFSGTPSGSLNLQGYEDDYTQGTYTRKARNYMQVVHVKSMATTWPGLQAPLLTVHTDALSPGVPETSLDLVSFDDAQQLQVHEQVVHEIVVWVELLDIEPRQDGRPNEDGVRVTFAAKDVISGQQLELVWVSSISNSVGILRMRAGDTLRTILIPRTSAPGSWLVCHHARIDSACVSAELGALKSRLAWFRYLVDRADASRARGKSWSQLTPFKRMKCARDEADLETHSLLDK